MKAEELQKQFKKETGDSWLNSQGEPDIDYVTWLENKVLASQFALQGKEKIIEIVFVGLMDAFETGLLQNPYDNNSEYFKSHFKLNRASKIADEILASLPVEELAESRDCHESHELLGKDYLNECIEKATPNLSKIKDVDKELDEIRGIKPSDLPTDEEIEKHAKSFPGNLGNFVLDNAVTAGFIEGAKWMRDRLNGK
jgi:hypothetical protein